MSLFVQLRPITPPPDSPPRPTVRPRASSSMLRQSSVAAATHIENTVAAVCENALAYSRRVPSAEEGIEYKVSSLQGFGKRESKMHVSSIEGVP